MYGVIQHYTFDPGVTGALSRQIKADFVPHLRQCPGFVAYYWLDNGDGRGIAFLIFEQQSHADVGVSRAADLQREFMTALVGPWRILQGPVKAFAYVGL